MYPLKLTPTLKNFIWGGAKLAAEWGKSSSAADVIAESWELSCHNEGHSTIANGKYEGYTLEEVLDKNPSYVGENAAEFEFFPILIKFIDAKDNLSIQVHPTDDYALVNEGQYGKTEVWYVADAEEGAGVYCGFSQKISVEEYKRALADGSILDKLNFLKVKAGDVVFIPAGTVHAICGGLVIYEAQQNSSITYRLYDYDRLDASGAPRQLHIDKGIAVTNTSAVCTVGETVKVLHEGISQIAKCKYFDCKEYTTKNSFDMFSSEATFQSLTFINGTGFIEVDGERYDFTKGDTYFIPAGMGDYIINGECRCIVTTV